LIDDGCRGVLFSEVGHKSLYVGARHLATDPFRRGLNGLNIAINEGDFRALFAEDSARGRSDATTASGNEGDFSLKPQRGHSAHPSVPGFVGPNQNADHIFYI
jgi:hypothetical protein